MIESIRKSLNKVDVLITTGSVSMGDRDMLKPILQKVFHATIHFGKLKLTEIFLFIAIFKLTK